MRGPLPWEGASPRAADSLPLRAPTPGLPDPTAGLGGRSGAGSGARAAPEGAGRSGRNWGCAGPCRAGLSARVGLPGCRRHGGAHRAAAGGPHPGARAAGAGRPLHAQGDQVGPRPDEPWAARRPGCGVLIASFPQGCPQEGLGSGIQDPAESSSEGGFCQLYSGGLYWVAQRARSCRSSPVRG